MSGQQFQNLQKRFAPLDPCDLLCRSGQKATEEALKRKDPPSWETFLDEVFKGWMFENSLLLSVVTGGG